VARRAGEAILADLAEVAGHLVRLTRAHRDTVQIGRTLMQQATPTTFGAVCGGWLVGVDEARLGLARVQSRRLAVQLGGPVGTRSGFGGRGPALSAALAEHLGLAEPVVPWHTNRVRVGELGAALGIVAGVLGTIALDVTLLAQTEVGEVSEGNPGGSSSMPHKRNPAGSVLVTAAAHRVPGLVATLLSGMAQETQRAAGRWQAEPPVVTQLLRLVGAAAAHTRRLLAELRVDAGRMRANAREFEADQVEAAGRSADDALRFHETAFAAPPAEGGTADG
jgi:3-carboxy-cis,cis-muconate cycloisomerase